MLKRQRFEDSERNATELRASKRPCIDENDNKEGQGSNKYQDRNKYQGSDGRYVPLPLRLQKELNHSTDLGKETKSLNYLVCIQKLPYQIIANFMLEFPGREGSKAPKKNPY